MNMMHTRWGYSMAGEEYARIHSWGHDPKRKVRLCESSVQDLKVKLTSHRVTTKPPAPAILSIFLRLSSSPSSFDTPHLTASAVASIQASSAFPRTTMAQLQSCAIISPGQNTRSVQSTFLARMVLAAKSSSSSNFRWMCGLIRD